MVCRRSARLRESPADRPQYGGGGMPGSEDADLRRDARNALRYVRRLERYPVWGHTTVNIERLIEPMRTTIIDLAGTEKVVMAYTAEWLLSHLWERALGGRLRWPVFVVLEEAHNLVPGGGPRDQQTKASRIINTVAAEGRKFGVYLIVITQRAVKDRRRYAVAVCLAAHHAPDQSRRPKGGAARLRGGVPGATE